MVKIGYDLLLGAMSTCSIFPRKKFPEAGDWFCRPSLARVISGAALSSSSQVTHDNFTITIGNAVFTPIAGLPYVAVVASTVRITTIITG
jgi:hypothetical protein